MRSERDIIILANDKLVEAECLLNNNMPDGAYYLAGYCVELLIKARICKTLGIPDFFDFDNSEKKRLKNEASITRPYKVHDLEQLLTLSGIYSQFEHALFDPDFKRSWSSVSNWSENTRYFAGREKDKVDFFVISVKKIMSWIQQYL